MKNLEEIEVWKVTVPFYEGSTDSFTVYFEDKEIVDKFKKYNLDAKSTEKITYYIEDNKLYSLYLVAELSDEIYREQFEKIDSIKSKLTKEELEYLNIK